MADEPQKIIKRVNTNLKDKSITYRTTNAEVTITDPRTGKETYAFKIGKTIGSIDPRKRPKR